MSKSSMLKEGMKGGLNGLLSSTKKPSKEQIVTETTPAPPVSVSETTEVPVHCKFPYQQEHPHEDEVPRHQERDVLA